MRAQARQEDWVKWMYAAERMNKAADELASMPEPDRTWWTERALMLTRAEADALEQDQIDQKTDDWINKQTGGF